MGERLNPPAEAAVLATAARRYAANLLAAAAEFPPEAVAAVRQFFGLVGRAEDAAADAPEESAWAWARFLAGWPDWQPHRLERRLLLPPPERLRDAAERARAAAAAVEPPNRLWSLFARAPLPAMTAEARAVLALAAELLDAAGEPASPAAAAVFDRALALGAQIESAIASLPREWVPRRLARAAAALPHWPSVPPILAESGFLPWLANIVQSSVECGAFATAPQAFADVVSEALADLRAQAAVPPRAHDFAALDEVAAEGGAPRVELLLKGFAELLAGATAHPQPSRWVVLLARLAARAVEQAAPDAEPPVHPDTLAVPRDWFRPERATLHYAIHPSAPRSVVRIDRFAVPPARPEATLSLGAKPHGATIWLTVDERTFAESSGEGVALAARCRKRAEAEFWQRNRDTEDAARLRKDWQAWLEAPAGREWFHATAAHAAHDATAIALLAAIKQIAGVECFPHIDAGTGRATWPERVPFTAAAVSFAAAEALPGTVLAVERFASQPAGVRMRVSLGPCSERGAAIAATWEAILAAGLELDGCRALLAPALEATARDGQPIADDVLLALLDHLADAEPATASSRRSHDEVLAPLRRWAAASGCTLMPAEWTFVDAGPAPPTDAAGLAVKSVFRRDVAAGRIAKVKRFGLASERGTLREGEVVVSAGPAPPGLAELEEAATALDGLEGEELREAFRGLRAAGAGGYLELAVVDLFTRFWDRAHPVWANRDPAAADDFGEKLRRLVFAEYGLVALEPANYRDHPQGWVSVPPGTRMTSGRVLRVLRPGLCRGSDLCVPARVEAE